MRYKIPQNLKNTLILMLGTVLAQALPIIAAPILTRIYEPTDFGIFAIYFVFVSIFSVVVTGRYEIAIVIPLRDTRAYNLVVLAILIAVITCFIMQIIVLVFGKGIINIINKKEVEKVIGLIPIGCLTAAIFQIMYYWFNRNKKYKIMARSRVVLGFVMILSQIILGEVLGSSAVGLIGGHLIAQIITTSYMLLYFHKNEKNKYKICKLRIIVQGKKYINFPKYFLVAHTIDASCRQLPSLFLNTYFGANIAGMYLLVQRVVGSPVSIVGSSIGDVFRQEASSKFANLQDCEKYYRNIFSILFAIALIPFCILYIYSPKFFPIIFGQSWADTGIYAQILMPMYFFQFIASPLSNMYIVAQRQKEELMLQVVMIVGLLQIFNYAQTPEIFFYLYTIFYSMVYIFVVIRGWIFSKAAYENKKNI